MDRLTFSLGVQGDKTPEEYIRIAKIAEECDFDSIFVYDDLLYYPAYPILVTMAQHTRKINLCACLLNGFYRHPAIIVSNYAYLNRMIGSRAIMGLGRGAFFDLLGMEDSEEHTRKGFEETLALVHHLLYKNGEAFTGELFSTTEKTMLKVSAPIKPRILTATWNTEMARLAGSYGTDLQIAEVWHEKYMQELFDSFVSGLSQSNISYQPDFNIGGMVCMGNTEREAIDKARKTVTIYLPYLQTILKNHQIDPDSKIIKRIIQLSKEGKNDEASRLIPDEIVKALSLVGTPDQLAERIQMLRNKIPFNGILFSPPYGTNASIEENIKYLKKELVDRLI
jgi:alkanesulfonate monooxygenase SsuD/methylene tetrahydromethanopterin reductase-like flavin-dependent oxidoreductase (luciferase family)